MPATTASATNTSVQARITAALKQIAERLGVTDTKLLAAAVAEVVANDITYDEQLMAHIRQIYDALEVATASKRSKTTTTTRLPKAKKPQLTPVSDIATGEIDPYAPLDAHVLLRMCCCACSGRPNCL